MQRVLVESSAIVSVGFDPKANVLEVEFTSGSLYRYFAVPRSVAETLLGSGSVGAAFNGLVHGRYAFVRVR